MKNPKNPIPHIYTQLFLFESTFIRHINKYVDDSLWSTIYERVYIPVHREIGEDMVHQVRDQLRIIFNTHNYES